MEFLHLKVWFMFLILYTEGSVLRSNIIKKRFKRYPTPPSPSLPSGSELNIEDFATLLNQSVPMKCPENIIHRRFTLSADSLQSMLIEKGGVIIPELIAREDSSAGKFKNLLNLGTFQSEEGVDHHFQSTESPISKSQIENDLRKWSYLTNFLQRANNSQSAKATLDSASDNIHKSTTISNQNGNITIQNNAIYQKISDFLHQSNITLNELLYYMRSLKLLTNPKILMSLQQHRTKRKRRNADGSVSTTQYCMNKGSPTKNNFLNLCGECAVTTVLPDDRFPRLLNEVVCGNDKTCLSFRGRPQGACLPTEIHVPLLRRRPGGCRMMISTSETVFVGEWELYTQTVRTGCSCSIDKRSYLKKYLSFRAPVVG